jgi:hypothetical protein
MLSHRVNNPRQSPIWQCAHGHFEELMERYSEQYEPRHGHLLPVLPEVVKKFLDCELILAAEDAYLQGFVARVIN